MAAGFGVNVGVGFGGGETSGGEGAGDEAIVFLILKKLTLYSVVLWY